MKYDFIFTGFGLSSMLVLDKMMESEFIQGKSILIIENDTKDKHDRTWCFWEREKGNWDHLVSKHWTRAYFTTKDFEKECLEGVYCYKMISSDIFYKAILEKVTKYTNIHFVQEKLIFFQEKDGFVEVLTNSGNYQGLCLFNSVMDFSGNNNGNNEFVRGVEEFKNAAKYPLVNQHFVGWFVKTKTPVFDAEAVRFMDFTVSQNGNTRFMYVLPITETEALLEYTLFSPTPLSYEEYEKAIKEYLYEKKILDFEITAKEQGCIPMTTFPFWKNNSKRILNIGTAGGWTKASTGYTFKNADVLSEKVLLMVQREKIDFSRFKSSTRFTFYDALFVRTLFVQNALGKKIFSSLFQKVSPSLVLKFLDEKTTWFEEVKVILACPKFPFLKSLGWYIKNFWTI